MPPLSAVLPWFRRHAGDAERASSGSRAGSVSGSAGPAPTSAANSTEGADRARESVRARHAVRLVSPQEEGEPLHRLPPGVYGFTYAPGLLDAPLFRKKTYRSYELHLLADGTPAIVGFASPDQAARFEAGREAFELTLFPDPQDEAPVLLVVPYGRIVLHREVSQHTIYQGGLRVQVAPADRL